MNDEKKFKQQNISLAGKIDKPMDFESTLLTLLDNISEWADDLEEPEMLLKYYYSVDYLFDLVSFMFDEHPDLLEQINKLLPLDNIQNLTPQKRNEIMIYTKNKFRICIRLLSREGYLRSKKIIYNTDLDFESD